MNGKYSNVSLGKKTLISSVFRIKHLLTWMYIVLLVTEIKEETKKRRPWLWVKHEGNSDTGIFSMFMIWTFMSFLKCIFSSYWKIPRTLLMKCKWSLLEINAIIKWRNGQRIAYCYRWSHSHLRSNNWRPRTRATINTWGPCSRED